MRSRLTRRRQTLAERTGGALHQRSSLTVDSEQVHAAREMRAFLLAYSCLVLGFAACVDEARPEISTQGLGRPCPSEGCVTGQVCVTAAGPAGETRSCEIECSADKECPRQFVCNLPPRQPDSIPDVCIDE
jgi:hypothetical protein